MRARAADQRLVSLIAEFMNTYLPSVKRRSVHTVESYRTSINLFLAYLKAERGTTIATLTAADICQSNVVGFTGWLADSRGNVATTVNHRLADIRGLCRFLESRGCLDTSAYELIREIEDVPDERITEFTWLEPEEVHAVLECVAGNGKGLRDNFLVSLLYESGGRIGEVLSLKVGNLVPTKKGEVDVHFYGKGNKHRITPLSSEMWSRFERYAKVYLPERKNSDLVFYVSRGGVPHQMSRDSVEKMLCRCEAQLRSEGWSDLQHLHPHLFRRTRSMHLYQGGVPIEIIAEWLGHSDIESTRFYAKITELMSRKAVDKLAEGDEAVFDSEVKFKYADDEETLKRLCGLA